MNVDPQDCFGDDFSAKSKPRFTYLTLGNKNPQVDAEERDGKTFYGDKEFGQFYYKGADGLQRIDPFNVVVLFYTPSRKLAPYKGAETKILCESRDGLVPSINIDNPFCREMGLDTLEQQLLTKNLSQVRVDAMIRSVTGDGKLQACCYKGATGGRWDLCPKSKKDEITGNKPCVYFEKIFIQDLDGDRQFRIDLKGLNLQNYDKYVSPWSEYKKWVWENKVPYWGVQAKLCGAIGPKGYAVWNFTEPQTISDATISKVVNDAHQDIFDWYNKQSAPPLDGPTKAIQGSSQKFDDDDIPF